MNMIKKNDIQKVDKYMLKKKKKKEGYDPRVMVYFRRKFLDFVIRGAFFVSLVIISVCI